MDLNEFEIYNLARELSSLAWKIYKDLSNEIKFTVGQQLVRSVDSVGANIAEGFGRYHYLDEVKFYYYSRGSLSESLHWFNLLKERNIIIETKYLEIENKITVLRIKLNNTISDSKNKAIKNKK